MNTHPLMLLLIVTIFLSVASPLTQLRRNFATIRSVINLAIQEHGLECRNAFSKVYLPDLDDAKKRKPIPIENIKEIQKRVYVY